MWPLLNPTKRRVPKVFQAIDVTAWYLFGLIFFVPSAWTTFSYWNSPSAMTGESFDWKSQTYHPSSVPIAIQWHLGLKANAVMEALVSWVGSGFSTSLKSKTLTFKSFPPVTMKFPLGEIAKALMLASWTFNESLMLKVWLFQTLRYPSHPTEAKYWPATLLLLPVGIYLTLETQSWWR